MVATGFTSQRPPGVQESEHDRALASKQHPQLGRQPHDQQMEVRPESGGALARPHPPPPLRIHSRSPDFRHNSTKDELWIDDSSPPRWVTESSKRWITSTRDGRGTTFVAECRPDNVFQVRSPQVIESSWTESILQHAKSGQGRQALRLYEEMQKDGVEPRPLTFVALLKACCRLHDLESVKQMHREIVRYGFETDLHVGTVLVEVYAKCKSLVDARHAFDTMPRHDVVSWTAMILGYVHMDKGEEALQLYSRMQLEGVVPNDRTYVGALKACGSLAGQGERIEGAKERRLETVRAIHTNIRKGKFESDVFVGNMLVDVYARCGSLEDARNVFEKMPYHNVVTWNAMIKGYAQTDKCEEGLQLFVRMQQEGVVPDGRTYVSLLKACSRLAEVEQEIKRKSIYSRPQCLETVRAIHTDILKWGFQSDMFVGSMLVDVYAKCGNLDDARHVFETMPHRDVVSWTAMIFGYSQMGKSEEALELFSRMRRESVTPDCRAYVSVLKACSRLAELGEENGGHMAGLKERSLKTVRAIHTDILKGKFQADVFVGNMLVDAYAKCGSLKDARRVFESNHRRDVVSWNSMIFGLAHMGKGEEALELYSRMQREGVIPDCRTYVGVLKACGSLAEVEVEKKTGCLVFWRQCLDRVRAVHADIMKWEFDSDVFLGNILVDVYAKCGSLEDARRVFDRMPRRSVVSWNAIILGYAEMGEGKEALQLFARMQQEGVAPDGWTYVSALKACSGLAELAEHEQPVDKRCLQTVRAIHTDVVNRKLELNGFVGNILVDVYAKCGSLEDARRVFVNLHHRDPVSWTSMIFGYAETDKGEDALELFARMQVEGVVPSDRTYIAALKACGSVAGLEKGKQIHDQICNAGTEAMHSFVASSLIDMYGKCGSMVDAQQVFDASPTRDIVAWSALIAGYAHQGESDLVFDLFHKMKHKGIQPDGVTFLGVLTVCSHVGLMDKGQEYFQAMSRDYGIPPTIEHFTCMVDLLGRAGHLDRAMEMVKTMPFQPSSALWNCVLGACRKWKNVELGRQAFECAVRLDRNDSAAYVLMSNIYSAAQMQEEAKEIQAMRLMCQAWKQPGRSRWTDTSGIVHVFVAGDKRHPESQSIYAKLGHLLVEMRKAGYVPHLESVLRDIPDEDKEDALCGHSERLAIAYALTKTTEGTTIRVVKNLRVCEDCHRATAIISKIQRRTIVCRDASRFHVFKDGKCSCRDYW